MRGHRSHAPIVNARGFTVVELLVAALIFLGLAGVVVALARPMHDGFDRGLSGADVSTRGRTGLELLLGELRQAGAGAAIGPDAPALMDLTAVATPLAHTEGAFRALSIMRIPNDAPQAVLRDAADAGASVLHLDVLAPCPGQDGMCGFRAGTAALIYDAARLERIFVASVSSATATIAIGAPLTARFNRGAIVAAVDTAVYSVRSAADGSARLIRTSTGGADQTIADHVVDFHVAVSGLASPPLPRDGDVPTYGAAPPRIGMDDDRDAWPAGENCTMAVDAEGRRVSRLPPLGASGTLVRLDPAQLSDGPWCADAGDPQRFDADLLRIRRLDLRLRVESADAALRGPPGRWFRRGGTARGANTWVPDIEVRASATLRGR